MAVQLVDNMAMEFHIEEFRDQYRAELLAMIDTKAKGMPVTAAAPREPGKVIDLMEALRRSVEMAQSRRTTGRPGAGRESGETAEPRTGRPAGQQKRAAGGGLQERPR
jgi:DNA end-binding protein Ku